MKNRIDFANRTKIITAASAAALLLSLSPIIAQPSLAAETENAAPAAAKTAAAAPKAKPETAPPGAAENEVTNTAEKQGKTKRLEAQIAELRRTLAKLLKDRTEPAAAPAAAPTQEARAPEAAPAQETPPPAQAEPAPEEGANEPPQAEKSQEAEPEVREPKVTQKKYDDCNKPSKRKSRWSGYSSKRNWSGYGYRSY